MTRVMFKDDIHVVVEPRREGDFGVFSIGGYGTPESNEKHLEQEAKRIVQDIRRHVDDVSNVYVVFETKVRCSHCGDVELFGTTSLWPDCCGAEQREFYAAHEEESDEWFYEHGMGDPDYLEEFRAGFHTTAENDGEDG